MTLLEVLVVLALLAGLAALVMPSLFNRLDERAFEAAADCASEQLMMARAHAQATGEAIEVTYSPSTGQVQARVYAPWSSEIDVDAGVIEPGTSPLRDASGRQAAAGANRHATASSLGNDASADARAGAIAEPWATRELGSGMSFARQPLGFPFAANDDGDHTIITSYADSGDTADDIETLEDLARGQEVRLALFMPDGSALVGDGVFLNDQRGRCGRLSVNPWSGLPMFVRLADIAARSAIADDTTADDDTSTLERSARGDLDHESDINSGSVPTASGAWDDHGAGDETSDEMDD